MIGIKYQPYSLLYGHSLFWLMYCTLAPLHLLPDLKGCKCRYVVDQLPVSKLTVWFVTKVRDNSLFKVILNAIFISAQMFYMFVFLYCNFSMTASSLAKFGSQYPESLTHKVLYNTPILSNGGLLIITLMNMLDSESHLWKIYDDFATLSIDYEYQARVAKFAILLTVPELLLNTIESFAIAKYVLDSQYYVYFASTQGPLANTIWLGLFYFILVSAGILNTIIRYRPVLTLLYASTCMSKHLALINSQMSSETEGNYDKSLEIKALDLPTGVLHERYNGRLKHLNIYDNQAAAVYNSGKNLAPSNQAQDQQPEQNNEGYFTISNLYALERHFTQISHLIYDLDCIGPESVLIVTAVNFMTYFFMVFHLSYDRKAVTALMFISVCCARTLPIGLMFMAGSWLEKECKRLVMKLESIYLRNKSQSLIYKQMASSHLSLARTLKTLERITFNCHSLMKVNTGTLKNCFIYLITIVLIVVQYDAIMYINVK